MIDQRRLRQEEILTERVLNHVERYRLTVPWVVAKLFFRGYLDPNRARALGSACTLLDRLVKGRLLRKARCPGEKDAEGPEYYLPAGASPGEAAVSADIALLWFCHGGKARRHRLTREDLQSFMQDLPYRNIAHCLEPVRGIEGVIGSAVIYRMAPTTAEVKEVIRMARRHLKDARAKFASLVDHGDYGFAILVEKSAKAKAIKEALAASHPDGGPSLREQARFVVAVSPRAESLARALRERTEEQS